MTLSEIARLDIGKKEKVSNSGFEDPVLEKEMREVGWEPGWSWCACAQERWVWKAYPELKETVKGLFVASAVNTFRNLVRAGYKHSMIPTVDALVYWQRMQDGKPQWQGHAGVVSKVVKSTEFWSIEGNTNQAGSSNGDGFYEKHRSVRADVENGLKVIGFVTLK